MRVTNNQYTSTQIKTALRRLGIKFPYSIDQRDRAMAHCPFHQDDTPSMSIDFNRGIFHCFSCDFSGTINTLSERITGRSLDLLLGINSSFSMSAQPKYEYIPKEVDEEDITLDIRGVIQPWRESEEATSYLKSRFIPDSVADDMEMGFIKEAYVSGTKYEHRLVIPIYGKSGKLINLEGRDTTGEHKLKCLYPHGTVKTIYEWYKLNKDQPLYVVEGLTKMACLRGDPYFNNSTTIFGASVTGHQTSILNTFSKIILIPDNDEPGKKVIQTFKDRLSCKFEVMQIGDVVAKDIDEIPRKLGYSIEEYRKKGKFLTQTFTSFLFGGY